MDKVLFHTQIQDVRSLFKYFSDARQIIFEDLNNFTKYLNCLGYAFREYACDNCGLYIISKES